MKEYNIQLVNTKFEGLEDALATMMADKRVNPFSILFLSPIDQAKDEEWEVSGFSVSTHPSYTNAPIIGLSNDEYDLSSEPLKLLEMVADEKKYISALAERICRDYDSTRDTGWTLTALEVETSYEIYLFIKPQDWTAVVEKVTEFNDMFSREGFSKPLTLDGELMMVGGQFLGKSEIGGFFEKRRVKKQNQEYMKKLSVFLDSLQPYLRNL